MGKYFLVYKKESTCLLDWLLTLFIKVMRWIKRIGRVHRLGQHRPVRVVNFIAQGTIEHGMLSLLSFKKSLFAGILDDGQDEVFLGGTRLKRFMDSVEKATTAVPAAMPAPSAKNETTDSAPQLNSEVTVQPMGATQDPQQMWNDLITAGASLLTQLAQSLQGDSSHASPSNRQLSSGLIIETDKTTGQQHLKLPLPKKETLEQTFNVLSQIVKKM
jgi:hypothetical protein